MIFPVCPLASSYVIFFPFKEVGVAYWTNHTFCLFITIMHRLIVLLILFSLCTANSSLYSCAGCHARNSYPVPLMESSLQRSDIVEVYNQASSGKFGIH